VAGARLLGQRVVELRKAAGLLQADLATQLATRDRRIGEWERGERQPHPQHLVRLAAALEVDPLTLLDVDPQDPPLLALRLAAGLTLQQLAAASTVPYSTYQRLETGVSRGEPASSAAQALASALRVEVGTVQRAIVRSRGERRTRL